MPKKSKHPDKMSNREAAKHLFPKPLRDALEEVIDVTDATPDAKPRSHPRKSTDGD